MSRLGIAADRTGAAIVGGAVLLAVAALWAATHPGSEASDALGPLALVVVRAGAGAQAVAAARRLPVGSSARAWRFMATALILAALSAAVTWSWWALEGEFPPVPSVAELLLLAGSSCALWALAIYRSGPKERFGRLRDWLDVSILFLSALGLSWLALIQPVLLAGVAAPVQIFWSLLWPVLDLAFLALVLRLILLADRGHERRSLGLLGLAGILALAGNTFGGLTTITGDIQPPWRVDVLLTAAALLAALAALEAGRARVRREGGPALRRGRAEQAEALLPIAFTYAVVGYVGVDAWLRGSVDPFGLGMAIALTLLLFARQGVVAGQSEMRQYAALVEGSADIAFICQSDGRISFTNPAFAAALRRPAEGQGDLQLQDVLTAEFDTAPILEKASSDGWSGEVTLIRSDGSRFPARLSLQPVVVERQRRPVLAAAAVDLALIKEREALLRSALDDVAAARTELMALNRDLEAKVDERTRQLQRTVEDLDRLNRELLALDTMKTEFVTLVSHELRAPLTNIQAGVELLLPEESGIPEPARTSLRLIEQETVRLGTFVEAILDLSALDAGRFPLRMAPLDFSAEARTAVDRFATVPGGDRIRLHLSAGLPEVMADERALGSVLYHLLDNALKYAPQGAVELGAEAETAQLRAWVRDSGPGIPEGDREKVFDRFHRLDASDAREVYGHGLGLHLVRRLLEAMGGGIGAEAAEGGGARLSFWLPLAATQSAADRAGDPSPG
jgi:signal transduction histidine kinase